MENESQTVKVGWFPGHMHKAQKELRNKMGEIDVLIEVADSRAPFASLNPLLHSIIDKKPSFIFWNKADLCDQSALKKAIALEKSRKTLLRPYLLGEAKKKSIVGPLLKLAKSLCPNRGTKLKPLRIAIIGIPNVGKSTLINTLVGRKLAKVGDAPAITKAIQRIPLSPEVQLLDSPGIMMPTPQTRLNMFFLAALGSIGEKAFDKLEAAEELLPYLEANYLAQLTQRYDLETGDSTLSLFEKIAHRVQAFRGNEVYREQVSERILRDLRQGALGKICLYDTVSPFESEEE